MATDVYKLQVEAFLREIGNEQRTIDLTNPLNTTGVNAPPVRCTVPQIYDCFWRAGLALYRVVKRMTFDEIEKYCPSFIQEQSVSLSSGAGVPNVDYEQIFDDAKCYLSGIYYDARRYTPTDALRYRLTAGLRKSPSTKHPKFEIMQDLSTGATKIYTYPTTFTSVIIKGYKAPKSLVLSSSGSDGWNQSFSDLLIAGAVAIFEGQTGQMGVSQMYRNELQAKYGLFKQPKVNQNNSAVEQEK